MSTPTLIFESVTSTDALAPTNAPTFTDYCGACQGPWFRCVFLTSYARRRINFDPPLQVYCLRCSCQFECRRLIRQCGHCGFYLCPRCRSD